MPLLSERLWNARGRRPCSPRRRGATRRVRRGVRAGDCGGVDARAEQRAADRGLRSKADLLLYGGAAGGGKTDLLLGLALTAHERAVIFRRAYADLKGIEQRLIEILRQPRGLQREPTWRCAAPGA